MKHGIIKNLKITHTYIHNTYIHTYIHTYVHTYIRTYIHTYIHAATSDSKAKIVFNRLPMSTFIKKIKD